MPSFFSLLRTVSFAGALLEGVHASNIFEELNGGVPEGWKLIRTAKADEPIKLRVALVQQNIAHFEQTVLDVSTPDHPRYGQHLQGHEVKAMLQPTEIATSAVISWLQDYNITAIDDNGDWVNFRTDVTTANKMLDTTFQWFQSDYKGLKRLRTLKYSVPEEVAKYINLIQPTTRFGSMRAMRSTINKEESIGEANRQSKLRTRAAGSAVDANCDTTITPQCLMDLYNIHYQADPNNGNKVGYASFTSEYARYADLATFEQSYAPYAMGKNFTIVEFGGLNDQKATEGFSTEANTDNQYILSISYPVPVMEFSIGGLGPLVPDLDEPEFTYDQNEPYLDYLSVILKLPNSQLPQTISHSYSEDEQSVPAAYAIQVCNMFAQLGARGVSVLFASGDTGVGDDCLSNDGKYRLEFQPRFPATCPFVTSVGGTSQMTSEKASSFSAGGFSRLYPRPLWQDLAVSQYLAKLGSKNQGAFDSRGRGFPDVAAQSYGYGVAEQSILIRVRGTSCAVSTFSGIVALLNSARISSNLSPLGFLNPWIYTTGRLGLNDITEGGSTGCNGRSEFNGSPNGSPVIPCAGWNATGGWDPVTGYGTPDFGKLLALSTPGVRNVGGQLAA